MIKIKSNRKEYESLHPYVGRVHIIQVKFLFPLSPSPNYSWNNIEASRQRKLRINPGLKNWTTTYIFWFVGFNFSFMEPDTQPPSKRCQFDLLKNQDAMKQD